MTSLLDHAFALARKESLHNVKIDFEGEKSENQTEVRGGGGKIIYVRGITRASLRFEKDR